MQKLIMQIICKKKRLKLIIIGTAVSGKSKLSLSLAKHFGWEIINTEPGWFFEEANIVTYKATDQEMKEIKHHCVDFLKLEDRSYEMKDFEVKVDQIVEDQFKSKRGTVIVGGSNFYNEKVIFQKRAKLEIEEKQDYYSRLKHNINLFANELLFHEDLKAITQSLDLELHFQKLLQKESGIDHSCLKLAENKLKYLLLNAPNKVLDSLIRDNEIEKIFDLLKKLFPFSSSCIAKTDTPKIRSMLFNFVNGRPNNPMSSSKQEQLKKIAEEETLVVILDNTDTKVAQKLIKKRVSQMVFNLSGIKEIFSVFERLLIRPESIFNLMEKFFLTATQIKCSVDELVLVAYKDVIDLVKINRSNRYGVLSTQGYKEFFVFFEKFLFILVNRFVRDTFNKIKQGKVYHSKNCRDYFNKFYERNRDELIEKMRVFLPEVFWANGVIKDQTEQGVLNQAFLESLYSSEQEMFLLYKRQRAWLKNRIVHNNLLENRLIVKEIKECFLTDSAFDSEVIQPVIRIVNEILYKESLGSLISSRPVDIPNNLIKSLDTKLRVRSIPEKLSQSTISSPVTEKENKQILIKKRNSFDLDKQEKEMPMSSLKRIKAED